MNFILMKIITGICLIGLTSIWVLGIKIVTSDGMLLDKLGKYGEEKIKQGYKIFEALWICQWCMPSLHSLIGYGFAVALGMVDHFTWKLVWFYPICVMGSSLFCGLTWTKYIGMNAKREYHDNAQKYYYLMNKKLKSELKENVKPV